MAALKGRKPMNRDEIAEACRLFEQAADCAEQALRELTGAPVNSERLDLIFQRKSELASSLAALSTLPSTSDPSGMPGELVSRLRLAQENALRSESRLAEVLNKRASI